MPTFKQITDACLAVWTEATPTARVGLVLLTFLSLSALGLVGYWSAQPSYVTLATDLDPQTVGKVVDELDKKGIQYELGGAGGIIKVDQRNLAMAKVAASTAGVDSRNVESSVASSGSMWLTPQERQAMEVKDKAREIENTINNFDYVKSSEVHLNVPINGPFERRVSTPTASVNVALSQINRLTDEKVLAIANTVAFSVEDLMPEAVNITDKFGRVYMVPNQQSLAGSRQLEYTAQQEKLLAAKAQEQLNRVFGPENSSVQITLDYTFAESSTESTEYDSEGKVRYTEDIETETNTMRGSDSGGPAGVVANLNTPETSGGGKDQELSKK
ncbi:MAG: flagellar M-ring protein FliF C-terminal domain-containing protein, partial [Planctomycetota bacterium]